MISTITLLVGAVALLLWVALARASKPSERLLLVILLGDALLFHVLPAIKGEGVNRTQTATLREASFLTGGAVFLWLMFRLFRTLTVGRVVIPSKFLFERLLFVLLFVSAVSAVMGLALGNALDYVVADFYKLAVPAATYFIVVWTVKSERIFAVLSQLYNACIGLALVSLIFLVALFLEGYFWKVHVLGVRIAFPILVVSYLYSLTKVEGGFFDAPRPTRLLLTLLVAVCAFVALERSLWVALAVSLIVLGLFVRTRLILGSTALIGSLLFCGVVLLQLQPVKAIANQIGSVVGSRSADAFVDFRRSVDVLSGRRRSVGSLDARVAEISDALGHMSSQGSPLVYAVGLGNGAEYPLRASTQKTSGQPSSKGEEFNHNIHLDIANLFFRQGMVGVLLYLGIFGSLVRQTRRLASRSVGDVRAISICYLCTTAIMLLGSGALWDIGFMIYTGLMGVLLRATAVRDVPPLARKVAIPEPAPVAS